MAVVGAVGLSPCPRGVETGGLPATNPLPVGSFPWETWARPSSRACRIPALHSWLVPERSRR